MASFGDALLSFAGGAASVINEDAERDREFVRKQKAKIAESRMIRQEKDYDRRKAEYDIVNKYGTGAKGQYMYAYSLFKDHAQAKKAAQSNMFASTLESFTDPGEFRPYEVAVTEEEVRRAIGDDSIAGKLVGKFGKVKERRSTYRKDQSVANEDEMDMVAKRADQALGTTTPSATIESLRKGAGVQSITEQDDGTTITVTSQENEKPSSDFKEEEFFKTPNVVDVQRDGGQLITTVKDGETGAVISTKATAIENYRTFTRPEVDLDRGVATWSETTADGKVTTFAGSIQNLPEEAKEGFKIQNATYNKDAGGYTVLERNEETGEMKTTFLEVEGVPEGTDQSKVRWLSFKAEDPDTGETVTKWMASRLTNENKIEVLDAIQVKTSTTKSTSSQPAAQFNMDRARTLLMELRGQDSEMGELLEGSSDDQINTLSRQVADEALRMSKDPQFQGMNFSEIEKFAAARVVAAEALRKKLREKQNK